MTKTLKIRKGPEESATKFNEGTKKGGGWQYVDNS